MDLKGIRVIAMNWIELVLDLSFVNLCKRGIEPSDFISHAFFKNQMCQFHHPHRHVNFNCYRCLIDCSI